MERQLIYPKEEKHLDYLRDESKFSGKAESISFPENEQEISEVVNKMREAGIPVTIQGGRTGISGGSVPLKGHILNLSNMNRVNRFIQTDDGNYFIKVQPGITLTELKKAVKKLDTKEELFWPVDPTEQTATVGGAAACNAGGICSYLYGDSKKYFEAARVVMFDGTVREIVRGENKITVFGSEKDLLDIYLGNEGIFGLFSELTLRLEHKPPEEWGISFFFYDKESTYKFINNIRSGIFCNQNAGIAAVEYMDRTSIQMIEERKHLVAKLKELPDVMPEVCAMVYIEIHGTLESAVEEIAEKLMEMAESCNCDTDKTWAVSGESEIEKLRAFRHAAAESANLFIEKMHQADERITKSATDMSIQNADFQEVIKYYEEGLKNEGLNACIFGHAAGSHLHVNILPESYEQYIRGQKLIDRWSKDISARSGKIITEHGVGKLKKHIFNLNTKKEYLEELKCLKEKLDPIGIWNPDNIFIW